ncbi:MAG: suppressor of fused domain protein [Myxococcota bacterium]
MVTDAIDQAFRAHYDVAEPREWKPLLAYADGGPDPLSAVRCYGGDDRWHYVGSGLSALGDEQGRSGWGFEVTFKLPRGPGESQPPGWPAALLQDLARYVEGSGDVLAVGDLLDLGRSVDGSADGRLTGLLFSDDPELSSVGAGEERRRLVQAIAVTPDELEAAKDWSCDGVLRLLAEAYPEWVFPMDRESLRTDPNGERAIQAGMITDGSARGTAPAETLSCRELRAGLEIEIALEDVHELRRATRGRLPFGRPFELRSAEQVLQLWPVGRQFASEAELGVCRVELDADQTEALRRGLLPEPGRYAFDEVPGLQFVVVAD